MTRSTASVAKPRPLGLETVFDATFATALALREKQIQQNYRPVIGVHKWFARRPGTVFRSLLLSEFVDAPLSSSFWQPHRLSGVIGDPFMGGGTPVFEANRLGFHVVGCDVNPMSWWIVRQSLEPLDIAAFTEEAARVVADVEGDIGALYKTRCLGCGEDASVKYFLWVKTASCPHCSAPNDLFPGYRLAEAERHPRHVLACASCGALNELADPPTRAKPGRCVECGGVVHLEGNVVRKKVSCAACAQPFSMGTFAGPPQHRMWAIEYHCSRCYQDTAGRQFKKPDSRDIARFAEAERRLAASVDLPIPDDEIPPGDESDRLHRWGYRRYREMFGARQLLGLGLLLSRIRAVAAAPVRHALLTVFSDTLRYQNMLCRYDTYALKCQDIFSVHGFPVGLVQCENSLLGIPQVGSGSFRHFVEKYIRAKQYCRAPFETRYAGKKKEVVPIPGETIEAEFIERFPDRRRAAKQAFLINAPSQRAPLAAGSLDGVFTDPPYFDNVQYAELIDFCFAWLRLALGDEERAFARQSTRSADELTGNDTLGRGMEHFSAGMSEVFRHFAAALKPGAPFVFTYHHNDPMAYLPLVMAILDADLDCTATLPAAAEMTASLHIAGTGSSILDSVFVCRKPLSVRRVRAKQIELVLDVAAECRAAVLADAAAMREAGVDVSAGDLRCLLAGHIARIAVRTLRPAWDRGAPVATRLSTAQHWLERLTRLADVAATVQHVTAAGVSRPRAGARAREARA